MEIIIGLTAGLALFLVLVAVWYFLIIPSKRATLIREAKETAEREAEMIKQKKLLEVKDKFLSKKAELEKEVRQRNQQIQQAENRAKQRELTLNQKQDELTRRKQETESLRQRVETQQALLQKREEELEERKNNLLEQERTKLEEISGISAEEAKERLVESLKDEAKTNAQAYINEIMDDAKMTANKEAKRIIIQTIQRVATETSVENSVTVFHIDNDEVKGRIIGREGRNIRALEAATGVEIVVDDTPEAIVISAFDPVRREICRLAMHQLVADGRIHPARIEELYAKTCADVKQTIKEFGKNALYELGLSKMDPELVEIVGRLHFRSSYSQNALTHSMEVANLAGIMASELGENVNLAKRAGLLHDIGKAIDFEMEGSHVKIGVDLAKKYGEDEVVINAIESHHGDKSPSNIISVLVAVADSLSAARPGARNDSLENYVKRLQDLEKIATDVEGVQSTFAIQAGRELRVIVKPEEVDDLGSFKVARDIKERIENELQYPGTIKVVVIRETRATEEAK